ncbi:hypothetical protein DRQ36_03220 [bacterium]|nr:MAG: hypothetical protein DRQ36_03220 [bacterium]
MTGHRAIVPFFFLALAGFAQDSLLWPLDCEHHITSTFAEFRVGHFHAGTDFRTPDGEGMPIIAPADGYVLRARETPWGYGKVVYFRIQDDITVVFAHLSGFTGMLAERMDAEKFEHKKNTAELWFKEGEVVFEAGDTIGFSGSTGAGSPHLHFELRKGMDTPFNAGYVGYIKKDDLPPQIESVWIIPRAGNAHINGRPTPARFAVRGVKDSLELAREKPIFAHGTISLCIEAFDRECVSNLNRFGAYKIELFARGDTLYRFLADTFSYSRTKQIGLLYDLGLQDEFGLTKPPFRLDHPAGADINLLKGTREGSGVIEIKTDTVELKVRLEDFAGNFAELPITIIPVDIPTEIPITINTTGQSVTVSSGFSSEDTVGLLLEYRKGGIAYREEIPIKDNPTDLPAQVEYVELKTDDIASPLWFWRPGESGNPEISISIPGSESIVVSADFDKPPSSLPLIEYKDTKTRPDIVSDTSFVFRIFDFEPGGKLEISWPGSETKFKPNIWAVKSKREYELADGQWRLEIPKAGVFVPFNARDTILPADSIMPERILIEPSNVVLRSRAKLSFDTTGTSADSGKLCLVRFWEGKRYFISNYIDDGFLTGFVTAFGTFGVEQDTIAPELRLTVAENARISKTLAANISDDLSGFSNDVLPNSYIDSVWRPTEYDPEKGKIFVSVEDIEPGEHIWRVEASDIAGNTVIDSVRFVKE